MDGTLKQNVKIIQREFLTGLALACNLISLENVQKDLPEPKTRSLLRQFFPLTLCDGSRSLFSDSESAEPCTALSTQHHAQLWLCAKRHMTAWPVHYSETLLIQTAVNTGEIQGKIN